MGNFPQGFDFNVSHAGALRLSKGANLGLRKLDVFQVACADLAHGVLNVGIGQAKAGRFVFVKVLRHIPNRGVPASFNVFQCGLNRGADLGVVFCAFGSGFA